MAVSIQNPADFLGCIVMGDETWVSHHTPDNKRQSMQWCHTHSPTAKNLEPHPQTQKSWQPSSGTGEGPLLVNLCLEETSSMLLFSKLKESLAGKTFSDDVRFKTR
jgi:hypothetical protein